MPALSSDLIVPRHPENARLCVSARRPAGGAVRGRRDTGGHRSGEVLKCRSCIQPVILAIDKDIITSAVSFPAVSFQL